MSLPLLAHCPVDANRAGLPGRCAGSRREERPHLGRARAGRRRARRAARTRRAAPARRAGACADTSRSSAGTRGRAASRGSPAPCPRVCARGRGASAGYTRRRQRAPRHVEEDGRVGRVEPELRSCRRSCRRSPSAPRPRRSRDDRLPLLRRRLRPAGPPVQAVEVDEREARAERRARARSVDLPAPPEPITSTRCTGATLAEPVAPGVPPGSRLWTERHEVGALPSQTCHEFADRLDRNGVGGGVPERDGLSESGLDCRPKRARCAAGMVRDAARPETRASRK